MLKGVFAGQPNLTFDYWPTVLRRYAPSSGYALTVHKSQAARQEGLRHPAEELPLLSRELVYTAHALP